MEYIRTAQILRDRAKALHEADIAEANELRARINELRAIAVRLNKYGRYLRDYYGKEGNRHAK